MQQDVTAFEVRRIDPADHDYDLAVAIALEVAGHNDAPKEMQAVADFLADSTRRNTRADCLAGVYSQERMVFSALLVESPGGAAMLLAPWNDLTEQLAESVGKVVALILDCAFSRGIAILETLIPVPTATNRRVLARCGFRHLTQLIYLQHRIDAKSTQATTYKGKIEWVSYQSDRHTLFSEAIAASYERSLDCPELCGVRSIDDVIAGHKASGDFDPILWFVAVQRTQPVGVLLLSRLHGGRSIEIVYMGVAQPHRGKGVSHALIEKSLYVARTLGATTVSLAVDSRNAPARSLYDRLGFREFARRDAWIAILGHS